MRLIIQLISLTDLLRTINSKKKKSFGEQGKEKGEEIETEQGSKLQVTMSFSRGMFHVDNPMKSNVRLIQVS